MLRHIRHIQNHRLIQRFVPQRQQNPAVQVSAQYPIHILFPVPVKRGKPTENPFGITMDLVQPVVEIALETVYREKLVLEDSLQLHFKDTHLSDAHGPNVAINQLVTSKLDCIIGYAFVYALAPVARMSPYWKSATNNGIPVITTIGLTSNLDNRQEYKLLTRVTSPYKVLTKAILMIFDQMAWLKVAYVFHEQRYGSANVNIPYGECYLQMASLQVQQYKRYRMDHNYFMFNELKFDHLQMLGILMKASELGNGEKMNEVKLELKQVLSQI
uniref:Receptor ligand binding region domain-containing protein n=1 Tax=Setaria digitata TaxID=48799 RepID=A0A915PKJ2_9BILA